MGERLKHISFLQFIGPILVILGHSINGMPSSQGWYIFSKEWIYIFHMPLFFFISGYMFSFKSVSKINGYSEFIKGKFKRLMVPYIVWNTAFIAPKIVMQNFIADDVSMDIGYLTKVFISPRQNIWGHTWFLFALFLLFLIMPIFVWLLRLVGNKKVGLWSSVTLVFIILYLVPINTYFMALSDLHKDILFFWIGMMIGQIPINTLKQIIKKKGNFILLSAGTGIITGIRLFVTTNIVITIITCFLTIMLLLAIPLMFDIDSNLIDKLAKESFGIYILHWPVMIGIRVLFYQVFGLNSAPTVVLMIFGGYVIPIIVIYILKRIKTLLPKTTNVCKYLVGI